MISELWDASSRNPMGTYDTRGSRALRLLENGYGWDLTLERAPTGREGLTVVSNQ